MSALITTRKRPRDRSINGPKKSFKNGLITKLISVRTTPTIIIFNMSPERIKPGTKYAAAIRASAFESILKIDLVINPIFLHIV